MTASMPASGASCDGGRIVLLDGLVVIEDEPFTDVMLVLSSFRRWSDAEIARYHRTVQRHNRWRWLPLPVRRVLRLPLSKPIDRNRTISGCYFDDGGRGPAVRGGDA